MNQLAIKPSSLDHNPRCNELLSMAQRELAALFGAVTELFGPKQAELSAEDWLHEVEARRILPASTREWRLVSAKVISQLANRCRNLASVPAPLQSAGY